MASRPACCHLFSLQQVLLAPKSIDSSASAPIIGAEQSLEEALAKEKAAHEKEAADKQMAEEKKENN